MPGAGVDLTLSFRRPSAPGVRPRILLLTDAGTQPSAHPVRVDVDTFDDVFARSGAGATILAGRERLSFAELDDFRPERLRHAAERLAATFASAPPPAVEPSSGLSPTPVTEGDGDTLARLLGRAPGGEQPPLARDAVDRFIRQAVDPHLVQGPAAADLARQAAAGEARAAALRILLHDAAFQRVEAAWLSVRRLADACADNVELFFWGLDKESLAALVAGPGTTSDPRDTAFVRTLAPAAPDAPGFSLVVADAEFGASEADVRLLAALARGAVALGAPLLAGAAPALAGCDGWAEATSVGSSRPRERWLAEAWDGLRGDPLARAIALVGPRLLLRLPYGAQTDPVDGFAFEELGSEPEHREFLWGGAAAAVACAIVAAWAAAERLVPPPDAFTLGGLPMVVLGTGDGRRLLPCAEVLLPEPAVHGLLDAGLTLLVSLAREAAVRVPRLQSIASPPARFAGPWA